MRKILFLLTLVLGGFNWANAASFTIPFQVNVTDVGATGTLGGHPRMPAARPNVGQDGHTLYFNNVGYDLTLVLLDEDGEEVYTTIVPAGTTSVVLPSTLSGDYELQLNHDDSLYYFYADIEL